MKRKAILHGPSTLTVSLPSSWVKQNDVKKGQELEVEAFGHVLHVSTNKINYSREFSIDVREINNGTLAGLLAYLHKNGYDVLHIICNSKQIKVIQKKINSMLIGYEIVEITQQGCVIRTIAQPDEEDFDKIFQRVFSVTQILSKNILEFIKEEKFEELEELLSLEETNNKLCNYVHRLINRQFYSRKRLSYIYLMSWLQENIADDYKEICLILIKTKSCSPLFLRTLKKVNNMLDQYYFLFKEFDFDRLEKIYKLREEIGEELEKVFKNSKGKGNIRLFILLSSITKSIKNSLGSTIAYHH